AGARGLALLDFIVFIRVLSSTRVRHSFPTRRSSDLQFPLGLHQSLQLLQIHVVVQNPLQQNLAAGAFLGVLRRSLLALTASERRSEEHTSELQSRFDLVCRLLLEKNNARYDVHSARV